MLSHFSATNAHYGAAHFWLFVEYVVLRWSVQPRVGDTSCSNALTSM